MRHFLSLLLLTTTILLMPAAALGTEDDERWIDHYVDSAAQRDRNEALAAESVAFEDLAGLRGQDVLVLLRNGQQRRGVVQRATGSRLNLRVPLPSGYADYELARADVQRVLREKTP